MTDQAQVLGFDIDSLMSAEAPFTYQVPVVFDKDGEPLSGYVIVGKNSPEYQEVFEDLRVEGIKKANRRKTVIDTSTQEGAEMLARLIKANDARLALSVVVGIFGFVSKGEEVPFSKAFVAATFEKMPTWKDKVTAALENDANFMPR
jgi:hypothetical protein